MNDFSMIAPCGINCDVCIGHMREKNRCPGCMSLEQNLKPKYCTQCRIKYCENHNDDKNIYCYACVKFPCTRMKQIDKRYKLRYRTSLIANLEEIKILGLKEFEKNEKLKWICKNCGEKLSIHKDACIKCGHKI